MLRDTTLEFRLTQPEKEAIERKAARADLSTSDLIRREVGLRVNRKPPMRPSALLQRVEELKPAESALTRLGLKDAQPDESPAN